MQLPAKALAQADEALEEAARCEKRANSLTRRATQLIRQAQMGIRGITVEIAESEEGTANDGNTDTDVEAG